MPARSHERLYAARREIDWCALTERLAVERVHTTGCEWCGSSDPQTHEADCTWDTWQNLLELERLTPDRPMA